MPKNESLPDSESDYAGRNTLLDANGQQFAASSTPGVNTVAISLLIIGALYFGREIFVPIALAILLSFMLAPLVEGLRRLHLPRVPAVILVVTLAIALIGAISVLVGNQLVNIANNLPTYQQTMQQKIRAIRDSAPGGNVVGRTTEVVVALGKELSDSDKKAAPRQRKEDEEQEPIPVRVEPAEQKPLEIIKTIAVPMLGPIGTAGIVIIFVIFFLLERSDLRDRFIRLAGGNLHRATEGLNEAASRVSRYLLMQLIVNATYGVPFGLALYFIGVPGSFLWGLLAVLLRFIPYLGPVIAAFFPLVLAFAVDPGWSMLLWTVAVVLGMELVSNNLIEPWLYGSSTGLSPVAVIFAAIFWTMLWGPVGLMLATPLTVCLVVLGRYVPQMKFLDVLFGSTPVLAPEQRLYQRLLAGNVEEAIEIAEEEVSKHSLMSFYDQVGLPVLRLAEQDRQRGASAEDRKRVAKGARAVVRDLIEQIEREGEQEKEAVPQRWPGTPVLCIAGRWELDAAAAAMLAHGLETRGIEARPLASSAIAPDTIGNLDLNGVQVVCVSYLNPDPQTNARFVCRRLKRRAAGLKIVLGVWNLAPELGTLENFAATVGADAAVTNMAQAVRCIESLLGHVEVPSMAAAPVAEDEVQRLQALHASGLLEARCRGQLDRIAQKVADAFDAPIALVSLVDESCQLWKGAAGLPPELDQVREFARETSICGHVVASAEPLVVEDTSRDPRFSGNPFLRAHRIRFYAGAPLRTANGLAIGSLCVLDSKPRTLSPRDMKLLQLIADELMATVEQRTGNPAAKAVPEAVPMDAAVGGPAGATGV